MRDMSEAGRRSRMRMAVAIVIVATGSIAAMLPSGSAAAGVPRFEIPIRSTGVAARDIAYDPVGGRLYVLIGGDGPTSGQLATIDPTRAAVLASQPIGSNPTMIEAATDGSALYVAVDGGATVVKLSLPALAQEWSYSLGVTPGLIGVQQTVLDMSIVPGSSDSIVIARGYCCTALTGMLVVDGSLPRPVVDVPDPSEPVVPTGITFGATPDTLYVVGFGARPFRTYRLASDGIREDLTGAAQVMTYEREVTYHDGVVYYATGLAVDVTTTPPTELRMPASSGNFARAIAVDTEENTLLSSVHADTGEMVVAVHTLGTFTPVREWVMPPLSFFPAKIIMLGNGLSAFVDAYSRVVSIADVGPPPDYGALGEYTSLTPARILDTRNGVGRDGAVSRVGAGQTIDVQIAGAGGVPTSGIDAVVMNVTAVSPTAAGYLTVFPTGLERPTISSLNFGPGVTVANLVTMPVGYGGRVSVYNPFGDVDVLIDVAGFYATTDGPEGARFVAQRPARLLDTRDPYGVFGTLGPRSSGQLVVAGAFDCCPVAVVLNVTVTGTTAPSFLSVYPSDVERPEVSNLNFTAGRTLANQVIVRRPSNGAITIYNEAGTIDVVVDIVGYFTFDERFEHGRFVSFEPFRAIDTRIDSPFDPPGDLWPEDIMYWGQADEPFSAFVMNVTVTETQGFGYLTAYPYEPSSPSPPYTSTVNYEPGLTAPNHAITGTGPYIGFYNSGGYAHLVVDVVGGFT